ncbi:MAG: hypothetical protein II670_10730 [Alphaproteobacteria bacterium]|nr:hypothetical protein [Alphaproteobacteria bacterium]
MKRLLFFIVLYVFHVYCMAQRYDGTRLYDFGLADSKELSHTLSIAIPCLLIGFVICWFTMWRKPNEKQNSVVSCIGCGGCLTMAIGFFFLLPLLAYVELIGMTLFYIVVIVLAIWGICVWIKDKL